MDVKPEALRWSTENCSIGRTLALMGERWTFLVMREVFQGVRRFEDMRVRTAVPRQVLSDRLDDLVAAGVLRREPYREPGARTRYEYRLTDKGLDAYPVLVALMAWGDRYLADEAGPAAEFVHRGCDEPVHLEMRCAADHLVEPREVGGRPGPGAVPLAR